ncbi:hypothetical protein OROHE_022345 [Orobanche hederae]
MGKRNRAAVVVLGDLGRSPRMQYHALSLARQAFLDVDIVAYGGSEPHISVLHHQSIHIHKMPQWPTFPRSLPRLLRPFFLILKPVFQFLVLLWYLCLKIPAPDVFIVQWIEKRYGKMAHGSLCVTRAMQHELSQNWGIKATVLYDQPPEFFRPASLMEKHNQCHLRDCIGNGTGANNNVPDTTPFTTQVGSDILLKQNRPALVVSSTSWTPDEDFGILLEAALMYDRRVAALLGEDDSTSDEVVWDEIRNGKQFSYPRLLFIITGKGPEKKKYEEKIKRLRLKRVAFRTMWLSAEDYPLLLGSADLGVCLHTSSSGLDLPMKVVDIIKELVDVEKNGLLFSSSAELADELMMLFEGFPEKCDALMSMRANLMERVSSIRWTTAWEENAKPLIYEGYFSKLQLKVQENGQDIKRNESRKFLVIFRLFA